MAKVMPVTLNIYAMPGMFRNDVEATSMRETKAKWRDFAAMCNDYGIEMAEVFPYSHDSDRQYPWRPYTKNWEVDKEWWKVYRIFLGQFKKEGITIDPVLWSKYQWEMYRTSGMNQFSEAAWKYLQPYIKKLARVHARKFPVNRRRVRLSNEIAHRGDHDYGIDIALWHQMMHEAVKNQWDKDHTKCDVSHSDFCKIEERHVRIESIKTGEKKLVSYKWYSSRSPEYRRQWYVIRQWGKDEYDRAAWIEWHGASQFKMLGETEEGSGQSYVDMMHQGSWFNFVWNLDGVSTFSGGYVPGTSWTIPTHAELYDWAMLGFSQNYGGVKCLLGYFPMEIFKRNEAGKLVEDLTLFDSDYLAMLTCAYRETIE